MWRLALRRMRMTIRDAVFFLEKGQFPLSPTNSCALIVSKNGLQWSLQQYKGPSSDLIRLRKLRVAYCLWERHFSRPLFTRPLPLHTYHLRGRKNEYSAQPGWRPLANMYHSQNQRIYKEKSKIRNEASYAEVWIGKLSKVEHAVGLQHWWDVNILTYK